MLKVDRFRLSSLMTVAIVLILTILNESQISFSLMSGAYGLTQYLWAAVRIASIVAVILFWQINKISSLYWAIFTATALLTLGLVFSTVRLIGMLVGGTQIQGSALLVDVALLALINVLTFSIWYWLIDPPGILELQPTDAPWDFLFPQRAACIPGYENWIPRYTDYLALAFYTSVAFSPTDAQPLTRRAKGLMIFQAAISLVTITVIAGSAINILGSG
jgi:hypothetical protein